MAEACGIQSEADQKMSAAEQKLIQEKQKMKGLLSTERKYYSWEMGLCKHLFASLFMLYHCLHAFWLFIFCITVKNKHKQEMKK